MSMMPMGDGSGIPAVNMSSPANVADQDVIARNMRGAKAIMTGDPVLPRAPDVGNMLIQEITLYGLFDAGSAVVNNNVIVSQSGGGAFAFILNPRRASDLTRALRVANGSTLFTSVATVGVAPYAFIMTPTSTVALSATGTNIYNPAGAIAGGATDPALILTLTQDCFFRCPDNVQNITFQPDPSDNFKFGFTLGGLAHFVSDTTNNTANSISGTFSWGLLPDVRQTNWNFSPPGMISQSQTRGKDARINVPCATGGYAIFGAGVQWNPSKPFKSSLNTGTLNEYSRLWTNVNGTVTLQVNALTSFAGVTPANANLASLALTSAADTAQYGKFAVKTTMWVSAISSLTLVDSSAQKRVAVNAPSPASIGYFDAPGFRINISTTQAPAATPVSSYLATPTLATVQLVHYFINAKSDTASNNVVTTLFPVYSSFPVLANIGMNGVPGYATGTIVPTLQTKPVLDATTIVASQGPAQVENAIAPNVPPTFWGLGPTQQPGSASSQYTGSNVWLFDNQTSPYVINTTALSGSSNQSGVFIDIPSMPTGTNYLGTQVTLIQGPQHQVAVSITNIDMWEQHGFEKAVQGPLMIVRGDNLQSGQNVKFNGRIFVAAEPNQNIAPYTSAGQINHKNVPYVSQDLLDLIAALYNNPHPNACFWAHLMTPQDYRKVKEFMDDPNAPSLFMEAVRSLEDVNLNEYASRAGFLVGPRHRASLGGMGGGGGQQGSHQRYARKM